MIYTEDILKRHHVFSALCCTSSVMVPFFFVFFLNLCQVDVSLVWISIYGHILQAL